MIYKVKASFNYEKAKEFYQKLTDGTIANQSPDGQEIINSMKRAIIDHHGEIQWSERCFCPSPLQHERATVYDHYFTEMKIEPIPSHEIIKGQSFMDKISGA